MRWPVKENAKIFVLRMAVVSTATIAFVLSLVGLWLLKLPGPLAMIVSILATLLVFIYAEKLFKSLLKIKVGGYFQGVVINENEKERAGFKLVNRFVRGYRIILGIVFIIAIIYALFFKK